MTELAVARAVARLDGAPVGEREQVVPPRLVVRGTTAPPAAGSDHSGGPLTAPTTRERCSQRSMPPD